VSVIDCREIVHQRGGFELRIPEWRVDEGQIVGVVGRNGAGKSSLLRLLIGLDRPTAGEVVVVGRDPALFPVEVRRAVGWVGAERSTSNASVAVALKRLSGYYPSWDEALCRTLLDRFDLGADQPVSGLSRGEASRFALVAAMSYRPRLLLLDEPGDGLDLAGRRGLIASVLGFMRDGGGAVVISSHQLVDLGRLADRLLVLDDGAVVHDGDYLELVPEHRSLESMVVAWGLA
jgi:ABC-type multidrug transport system ATPase subunit